MTGIVSEFLNEGGADLRRRLIAIYAALIGGNILIWLWALVVLGDRPVLLGTARAGANARFVSPCNNAAVP